MNVQRFLPALLGGVLLMSCPAFAHDGAAGEERVAPLLQQALPDAAGKKAVMLTVNYAPGQASAPHIHPGSVFAYVLEGEVVSQLGSRAPVTYKAGDYWYEAPMTPHLVSRNASASKPAKLLVWLLVGEGEQAKLPLRK
jgi:quercetin dioxygenase-like cupin family protein